MSLTLRWSAGPATSDGRAVVQVSRLALRRRRDVPGFLWAAVRLRRAVRRADGALGVSLVAQPWRATFWTLSAWTDPEAITAFMRSDAHLAVMRTYRDRMAGSHFHTWHETTVDQLPPSWRDARRRFDASLDVSNRSGPG
jgi:heme-degrading monooxygenase HmoA